MKILSSLLTAALLSFLAAPLAGEGMSRDWPRWSGPHGDLSARADALFADGFALAELWSKELGPSYAGVAVADGRIVVPYSDGESDLLVALDAATGEERWRHAIGPVYAGHDGSEDGPLATPAIAGGTVYALSGHGRLAAVDLESGEARWSRDLAGELGARPPTYGFTTAPLVVGETVIVQVGGPEDRSIAAFDRTSGELRWSTGDDPVGYQSPQLLEIGGRKQIVAVTSKHLMGLEPATGEVLWRHEHGGRGEGWSHPVPVGKDRVLLSFWPESVLYRVVAGEGDAAVEEVWRSRALRGSYALPVLHEGHLYGFSGNFLTCVDAATGKAVWKSRPPGGSSLILVDGHLVIHAKGGEVVVAEATPEGYREKARLAALDAGHLSRPAFAGGRIYVRNSRKIAGLGVTEPLEAPAERIAEKPSEPELRGRFGEWVEQTRRATDKRRRVERFLEEQERFPPVEPTDDGGVLVHFLYHGEVPDLAVTGDFLADEALEMHRLEGTDLYFRTVRLDPASQYTYSFQIFDEIETDPRNPEHYGPEDRRQSVLTTPGFEPRQYLAEPQGSRGELVTLEWKSESLGNEREVQVYLPPGYDASDQRRYPLLVVHHGGEALAQGEMQTSLDNLVGRRIEPLVVAFVPPLSWPELAGSGVDRYSHALATELVPLLERNYRVRSEASERAILGAGSGGFLPVFAAFQEHETFGKAAAHSFWRAGDFGDELWEMVREGEKRDLELVLQWSRHDYRNESMDADVRRDNVELARALEKRGYRPTRIEVGDGTGWSGWRLYTGRVLEELFPLEPSS